MSSQQSGGVFSTEAAAAAAKKQKKPGGAPCVAPVVPAAKRRQKKKQVKSHLGGKVDALVPESRYYSQLLGIERRIDSLLSRKKVEIDAALRNTESIRQRLRVYVYNTHENQGSSNPADAPCWTLVIFGRLVPMDDSVESAEAGKAFSSLLKSLEVVLEPEQPGQAPARVSWSAADGAAQAQAEAFEIKRRGSGPRKATIRIGVSSVPERYQLSQALAGLLGVAHETRSRAIRSLWAYIRSHGLQRPDNPTLIRCDQKLRSIFREEQVPLSSIGQRISSHLSAEPPLELEYTVDTSGKSPTHPDCYEIDVDLPPDPQPELQSFLQRLSKDQEVHELDSRIMSDIEKINEHRRRHTFFTGFSQSPVDFINSLVASQARDLRAASGEGSAKHEALRRTEVFQGKWVEDAVFRYLQRRLITSNQ